MEKRRDFSFSVRQAKPKDASQIQNLINFYAKEGLLLPRSLAQIYSYIRDYYVACSHEDQKIIGCVALHVTWEDIGELRSLAVHQDYKNKRVGENLVYRVIEEARLLELEKIFVLTFSPDFFKKFGFKSINKEELPQKVWQDCLNCPHFPNCKEESLLYSLR